MAKHRYITRAVPRGVRPPVPIENYGSSVNGDQLAQLLGLVPPTSSVYVTPATVKGIPAVDAAVNLVANSVGMMMASARVFSSTDDELPVPPIVARPNSLLGRFEFWKQATATVVMHGNYVSVLADHDLTGWPRQCVPIPTESVNLDVSSGLPEYRIADTTYGWDGVLHVRNNAPVGSLWGEGVVTRYRRALSGQIGEQVYGESSFRTGGMPSAVVELDVPSVPKEQAESIRAQWIEKHGGGDRAPAVLPRTMKITPISWSPEDMEFIQARAFSIAEAALLVGLNPSDLEASFGAGNTITYQNLTDRQLSRLAQSFAPWMNLLEEAFSDLLPGGQKVRGNPEALLRTSTRERYELHKLAIETGLYSTEHAQDVEKLPRFEKPKPPAPPPPPANEPPTPPEEEPTDEPD